MGINFALVLLSIVPHMSLPTLECDSVEINHFYDENGKLVFDQFIMRDWNFWLQREVVQHWKLIKDGRDEINEAERDEWNKNLDNIGPYNAKWNPRTYAQGNMIVLITGEVIKFKYPIRETWSQVDPELIDRDIYPKEKRCGAFRLPYKVGEMKPYYIP